MLIGLVGYARAGKDTVAEILADWDGYERVAFADPLKELALRLNPSVHYFETRGYVSLEAAVEEFGWDWVKDNTDAREFLQDLGDGARQIFGDSVWMDLAEERMKGVLTGRNVVVTDCRYINECYLVHDLNGAIWRIDRPGVGPANDHVTESDWQKIVPDAILQNDSDKESLHRRVGEALADLKTRSMI
jgi:hypothetical protein